MAVKRTPAKRVDPIKAEVMAQLAYIRVWGGKFVTAVPRLETA